MIEKLMYATLGLLVGALLFAISYNVFNWILNSDLPPFLKWILLS